MKKVVGAGLAAGAASAVAQKIGERTDLSRHPAPGEMIEVDRGRRIHVVEHGGSGTPIVVETGAGSLARTWDDFVPRIVDLGRVITYDRAGYGWSDPGGWPRDGLAVARDLRAVLEGIGAVEPAVLVGHSLGGLYVRCFAAEYPESTAGLVLVDSSHEDMLGRLGSEVGPGVVAAQIGAVLGLAAAPRGLARAAVRTGLARGLARSMVGGETADEVRLRTALYLRSGFRRASLAETAGVPATMRYLRTAPDLGSLPVAVVSAAEPDGDSSMMARLRPTWMELQRDLAARSTDCLHLVAERGGHFVHQDDPDAVERGVRHVFARLG